MDSLPSTVWIAACAHRLQRHWRTVDPDVLEETAAELWRDERLRSMGPTEAASDWLKPLEGEPAGQWAKRGR
ncbi:hypothetical protein [Variovorax rhizosphaerae]|uniref:Uncharacterized protein n=1 Tax=Variovorax rhizosphaerae TaxID=1836200 RepID=A0ABU8WTS5_9BURK